MTILEKGRANLEELRDYLTPRQFAEIESAYNKMLVVAKELDEQCGINSLGEEAQARMNAHLEAKLVETGDAERLWSLLLSSLRSETTPPAAPAIAEILTMTTLEGVRFCGKLVDTESRERVYNSCLGYSKALLKVLSEQAA